MFGLNADYLKPKTLPKQIVSDILGHCETKKNSSELNQNECEFCFNGWYDFHTLCFCRMTYRLEVNPVDHKQVLSNFLQVSLLKYLQRLS